MASITWIAQLPMHNHSPMISSCPVLVSARHHIQTVRCTVASCRPSDDPQSAPKNPDDLRNMLMAHGLPQPPVLPSPPQSTFNPVSLAYLGDAIWEALVRQHVWRQLGGRTGSTGPLGQSKRPQPSVKQLHDMAASWANATQQAHLHDLLVATSTPPASGSGQQEQQHAVTSSAGGDSHEADTGATDRSQGRKPPPRPGPTNSTGVQQQMAAAGQGGREPTVTAQPGHNAPTSPVQYSHGSASQPATVKTVTYQQAQGLPGHSSDKSGSHQTAAQASNSSLGLCLNASELDILRWARNSSAVSVPLGVDSAMYKKATALEVLVAHLYLTNPDRCVHLVDVLLTSHATRPPGRANIR